jgi:hypothetical protein
MESIINTKIFTLRRLPILIEIGFWNLAIILLSESLLFQRALQWSFQISQGGRSKAQWTLHLPRALFWAFCGWLAGVLIGFIWTAASLF